MSYNQREWDAVLKANNNAAPHDALIQAMPSPCTLYGTIPVPVVWQAWQLMHITLPRDLDDLNPKIVQMLKPWLQQEVM